MPESYEFKTEDGRYERIHFAERKDAPDEWTVEAYGYDGGIEQAIFIGPNARERAEEYLIHQYGARRPS